MQPYQEASQEIARQGNAPLNLGKKAAGVGSAAATAYFGGSVINRVLPFLSKYIPEELAIKGLNKIDPRFGKFINKAMAAGQSFDEIKDFIGSKVEEGAEQTKPPKQNQNIIEQYSPELHQFISSEISGGRPPIEAAAIAQNDKRFSDVIKKLSKDHKSSWSSIIQTVYGQGQKAQTPQQQSPQTQANQQPGQGQQALMSVLNKINQRLGQ